MLLLYASSLWALVKSDRAPIWHDRFDIDCPAFLTVKQIDSLIILINRDNRTVIVTIPNPIANLKCSAHLYYYMRVPSGRIGRLSPKKSTYPHVMFKASTY